MTEMLRPMSTGELMDRTLVLYKKNFKLFVGIASLGPATYLLFQLLTIGSAAVPTATPNTANPFSSASVVVGVFAGLLIMLAGMALAHGATVRAIAAGHLGLPILGEKLALLAGGGPRKSWSRGVEGSHSPWFWAGVSFLESEGVWRPDKARTPREYLNAIPAANQTKPSFAAVTRTFEASWYGGRPTSAPDFERFVAELEKLGCRG